MCDEVADEQHGSRKNRKAWIRRSCMSDYLVLVVFGMNDARGWNACSMHVASSYQGRVLYNEEENYPFITYSTYVLRISKVLSKLSRIVVKCPIGGHRRIYWDRRWNQTKPNQTKGTRTTIQRQETEEEGRRSNRWWRKFIRQKNSAFLIFEWHQMQYSLSLSLSYTHIHRIILRYYLILKAVFKTCQGECQRENWSAL